MKSLDFETVILGGGCIGASILYELLRQGHSHVALIDHGRRTLSATAKSGGLLRVFHESPDHIDLALANHRSLHVAIATGVLTGPLIRHGSLYFFNRSRFENYKMGLKRMDSGNYPFEVLSSTQGQTRFPQFRWAPNDMAIFEPEAFQISPSRFVDDLFTDAKKMGANIFDSFDVRVLRKFSDRYRLCNGEQAINTRSLILAGGARMLPLLRDLGLVLSLEARVLRVHLAKSKNQGRNPALTIPSFFDRETLAFGHFGPDQVLISDPQSQRLGGNQNEKPWQDSLMQVSAEDCYSPNRTGILGEVPGFRRLFLATGWGGTAFKYSLEIGRRMARLIDSDQYERSYHA